MAQADEQVLCKKWDGPGPSMGQPAETEQLKSSINFLPYDESYFP